ncbi:MAG TPA: YegP family protein [Saprospiraceae bacterium]|nr:YegP family protein [Saprospiraceae bacterium]
MGKFVISTRTNGDFQFNLLADNNQVILTSQGYSNKAGCMNGVESVRTNAPNDSRYERNTAANGKFFFNLKAANAQVVGTSQMYENARNRDNGIESVKNNAPGATLDDQTGA